MKRVSLPSSMSMSDIEPPFVTATKKLQGLTANVCLLQLASEFFEFFSLLFQLIFLNRHHWSLGNKSGNGSVVVLPCLMGYDII